MKPDLEDGADAGAGETPAVEAPATEVPVFEEDGERAAVPGMAFVVDIDGYEGPIDVLLAMARQQKVDLAKLSILQLADQYLAFVAEARRVNLELAADYLVMAAWLAYLKSRLLLPDLESEEEPSGEAMAAALAFQLRRLEAMQQFGLRLMARPRLGSDFFARGMPERFARVTESIYDLSFVDVLKAYGDLRVRQRDNTLHIAPTRMHSVEEALTRFRSMLGSLPDWESLWRFLPADLGEGLKARSAIASTFAASLELVKEGRLRLRQNGVFGPIYLSAGPGPGADEGQER